MGSSGLEERILELRAAAIEAVMTKPIAKERAVALLRAGRSLDEACDELLSAGDERPPQQDVWGKVRDLVRQLLGRLKGKAHWRR